MHSQPLDRVVTDQWKYYKGRGEEVNTSRANCNCNTKLITNQQCEMALLQLLLMTLNYAKLHLILQQENKTFVLPFFAIVLNLPALLIALISSHSSGYVSTLPPKRLLDAIVVQQSENFSLFHFRLLDFVLSGQGDEIFELRVD